MKLIAALALSLIATAAQAAPVLKADVLVTDAIVTVGDMFDDAGDFAGAALFRAPAPGTAGSVSLDAVRQAAALVGLTDYDTAGVLRVRVARDGVPVDAELITDIITSDLVARGIVRDGITVRPAFDGEIPPLFAEAVINPVDLVSLRYTPGNGGF